MRRLLGMDGRAFPFKKLAGDIEEGTGSAHAKEGASGRECGFRIPLVVADERRAREIEVKVPLCLVEEARFGLPAVAAPLPIVRAIIDGVDSPASVRDLALHAVVDSLEIGLAHETAADSRLVGSDDCAIARSA